MRSVGGRPSISSPPPAPAAFYLAQEEGKEHKCVGVSVRGGWDRVGLFSQSHNLISGTKSHNLSLGVLTRRVGVSGFRREEMVFLGGHCEPLHLFPDWLRPLHRLTMEMLAQEKRLYSGALCESAEGVAAAANFRICLSLNGGNCWELPMFQIVAWKRGGGGGCHGLC